MSNQENTIESNSIPSDIPLIAIEAANELDELVCGRPTSFSAVISLARSLKNSFTEHEKGQSLYIDSGTVAVFCDAFNEFQPEKRVTTVDELIQRALDIAKELDAASANHGVEKKQLEKMRDFCIALSTAAASFRNSIYEQQPPHPFEA